MDSVESIRAEVRSKQRSLAAAYILRVYLSINSLGFTVSLPTIMKEFGALDFYPVLMVLNTASMAILALVGGKLIDMVGVKRMTVVAVTGVSVAAAFAAFAPNLSIFVIFYIAMAACHGIGISMPVAIICDVTHSEERSRYMGLYSAANNLGLLVGPLLGGVVTDNLGYHITPLYPLFMPVVVLFLIIRYYPKKQSAVRQHLDIPGALLSALVIASFLVVLNVGGKYFPWSSPVVWGTAIAFVVFLLAFLFWEKRSSRPLLNLRLFKIPSFTIGVLMVLLGMPSINLAANYVTLYVQSGMGYSATFSGTFALPKTCFVILVTVVLGGWLSRHTSWHKGLLILGACVTFGTSLLLFFGTGTGSNTLTILVLYVVTSFYGVGEGLNYMTAHPYYQKDLPESDLGSGISVQTLCTTMGATLSATSYGAVLNGFGGDVAVAFPYMGLVVCVASALYLVLGIFFVKFGTKE
ncbi:MAG: MFS transporter [Oscillospiraceae bacterium]|nr:MFS transporter [Oscillospiraceae bacterium]